MDMRGAVHLGDPGSAAAKADAKRADRESFDVVGAIGTELARIPRPVRLAAGVLALIAFGVWGVIALIGGLPNADVSALRSRTSLAGRAFLDKNLDALKPLAATGTEESLVAWYKKVRPNFTETPAGCSVNMVANVEAAEILEDKTATSAAVYFFAKPGESKPEAVSVLVLPWVQQEDVWRLNSEKLIKDATKDERVQARTKQIRAD
jgi:hypothetical protein